LAREQNRTVPEIAAACGCTQPTVYQVLHRYREGGLENALVHKTYTYTKTVTAEIARRVIALSESAPPAGHRRWTDELLAQAAIEQGIAKRISRSTVCRILRKHQPHPTPKPPASAALPVVKRKTRLPMPLKDGEKERLDGIVNDAAAGGAAWTAWQVQRAAVLLYLSLSPALTKQQVADLCHCSVTMVNALIRQYEAEGLERVLSRQRGGRKEDAEKQ
jgi:transposase